jgi:hypothetical protein
MAATRTDIHRPGSPEFNPGDYRCRGVFDLEEAHSIVVRTTLVAALVGAGYSFTDAPHGGGQCSHCGHWPLRYVALMSHEPTKTLMHVGETCLDNRFSLEKGEFAKLRKAAKLNRARSAKQAQRDALVTEHPELAELLDDNSEIVYGWGDFLPSLADQFRRNGTLSERQIAAAVKSITKGRERIARRQAEDARRAAAAQTLLELPAGRVEVTGVIKKVTTRENDFGVRTVMVVTVTDGPAAGWIVDGTLPSSLDPGFGSLEEFEGKRVRFAATLKPASGPGYAWFSRPTKAAYVD